MIAPVSLCGVVHVSGNYTLPQLNTTPLKWYIPKIPNVNSMDKTLPTNANLKK